MKIKNNILTLALTLIITLSGLIGTLVYANKYTASHVTSNRTFQMGNGKMGQGNFKNNGGKMPQGNWGKKGGTRPQGNFKNNSGTKPQGTPPSGNSKN